jgi:hypothetical protein
VSISSTSNPTASNSSTSTLSNPLSSTSFKKNIYLNIQLSIETYLLKLYTDYKEDRNKKIIKNTIIYLNGIIQSTIVKISKNESNKDKYFKNLYNLLILILLNTIYNIDFNIFEKIFSNLLKDIFDDYKIKVKYFNEIKQNNNYIDTPIDNNIIENIYNFTYYKTINDIFIIFNNIIRFFNNNIIIKSNNFEVGDFCVFIYNKNIYYGQISKIINNNVIIDKNSLYNFLTNKKEIPLLYTLINFKINIKNIISYDRNPILFTK